MGGFSGNVLEFPVYNCYAHCLLFCSTSRGNNQGVCAHSDKGIAGNLFRLLSI